MLAGSIPGRVADVVAMEVSILYYAFASWRRPFVPVGAVGFTSHRKSGLLRILYTAAGLSVVEILVVDLVLRSHHPLIANAVLAIGVFGAVWLLGFARGNILWMEFDRARIRAEKRTPGYLRPVTQSNVMIALRSSGRVDRTACDARCNGLRSRSTTQRNSRPNSTTA